MIMKLNDKQISDFYEQREMLRKKFMEAWDKCWAAASEITPVAEIAFQTHMEIVQRQVVFYTQDELPDYLASLLSVYCGDLVEAMGYDLAAGPAKKRKSLEESYPKKKQAVEPPGWIRREIERDRIAANKVHPPVSVETHCPDCGYHVCSCAQLAQAKADLQKPIQQVERDINKLHGADILKMLW